MGFAFNPFTGNFDAKGSGGGGSSYIDGEVLNFSALPETAGTPPVDSAYLVREAEGTWLLNRKPAGIYIRTANTGTRASDWTYAGEFPDVFSDANFVLYDNGDSTRNLQFQLSGIDTATTRTLTAPNASGTIARTEDFAAPPAIGSTTPNTGAFTTLTANAASGSALAVTDTTASSDLNYPLIVQRGTTRLFGVRDDGVAEANLFRIPNNPGANVTAQIDSAGLKLRDTNSIQFSSAANIFSPDTFLLRDGAAGTLAQRNAANPQTFRLYNTFTDASNYERGFMRWSSNVLQIGTEKAGTGSARALELRTDNTARLTFGASGTITLNTTLAADAQNISTDTTTGTKIGTGTTQKIGFFNATPVVQQAAIADATDAATTQARLNDLLATMRTFGLIAT